MEKPWKKHYTDRVPGSLKYPPIVIDELLRRSSKNYPTNTVLIFGGNRITYQELDRLVDIFAGALFKIGVKKGDRIALLLPNCP